MSIRVRFAPSPTGKMHLGNARTALFNFLFARQNNGQFILRIEDTDKERSKQEHIDQIVRDLTWLKLKWDEGFDCGGEHGPYLQSDRSHVYEKHLQDLRQKNLVYECFCTAEELEERRQQDLAAGRMPRYDNRCRQLTPQQVQDFKQQNKPYVLRFKVPEKVVTVQDLVRGEVQFDTKVIGDFVLVKSDGGVAFNFAVSVDDGTMGITHVIRGEDHLSNTPRHILLLEAMGYPLPHFAHLPMILGSDGAKLSKRHGITSVEEFRCMGFLPEGLVNYLSFLGWSPDDDQEVMTLGELVKKFSLQRVNKSAGTFDLSKLKWINSHHLRQLDLDRLCKLGQPFLKEAGLIGGDIDEDAYAHMQQVIAVVRGNLECLADLPREARIFYVEDLDYQQLPQALELLQDRVAKEVLIAFRKNLAELDLDDKLQAHMFKDFVKFTQKETQKKGKQLFLPLRVALTARMHGPELPEIAEVLGLQLCLQRLNKAILL